MKTIAFHNLGCKVNAYETDVMMQKLKEKGWNIVPFDEKADVYVVNTCTVTNMADRKSRQMLHRAKKMNPDALVIAVGCYVETGKENVAGDEAIDLAIGTNKKGQIAEIIEEFLKTKGLMDQSGLDRKTLAGKSLDDLTHGPVFESMMLTTPGRTRADIKIEDGCNQFCSYCIIPYARGRVRSRRPEEVLEEVRGLSAQGVKEIVVTGVHIGSYGLDFENRSYNEVNGGNPALLSLLLSIAKIEGIERIRLGSLEPRVMDEEFVKGIAGEKKICPHFHLSLQSGSDTVLKRMNRGYTAEEFMKTVERLRTYYDAPALTTDVIVGFPGESGEEFEECLSFLRKVNFYEIHVFKYSRRHGTVADRMPDQIPEGVKDERSLVLQELTRKQAAGFRENFLGGEEEILAEEVLTYEEMCHRTQMASADKEDPALSGTRWIVGHTARYVEAALLFNGTEIPSGTIVRGRLTGSVAGTSFLRLETEGL